MAKAILYKATNRINGKFYIGITSKTIGIRRSGHFAEARSGSKTKFHRALSKWGRDAFEWVMLDVFASLKAAGIAEIRAIAILKPAYNIHRGGHIGSAGLPDSVRKTMNAGKQKKVRCVTTGEVFKSCIAAANAKGVDKACVSECCRGRLIQTHGLRFAFEVDYLAGRFDPNRVKKLRGAKPVTCIDDGAVYPSVNSAAAAYGARPSNVHMVCTGQRRIAAGRKFKYVDGPHPVAMKDFTARATLTTDDVREIRAISGTIPRAIIAARYGVLPDTITNVRERRTWKEIA